MEQARVTDRDIRKGVFWALAWLVVTAVALTFRPLMPIDETRYLSVAWDMWRSGDLLVPHLNGEPYSQKPPLLFWLINLIWSVVGVNEVAARAIVPVFGFFNLILTALLAKRLWPENGEIAVLAPLVLLGSPFWAGFVTLTYFDALVGCFTLIALLGIVDAADRGGLRGWIVAGMALGLGILSKGPVALVFILPAALFAPFWLRDRRALGWIGWYLGIIAMIGTGAGIALAWAVPAADQGGDDYAAAILWGQTAGRMVESFAHESPWWTYLAVLPMALFPWSLWPPLWRGLADRRGLLSQRGIRFALAVALPVLLFMSAVSGKQAYYLIPLLPVTALAIAAVLEASLKDRRPIDLAMPAAVVALVVLALLALQADALFERSPVLPDWAHGYVSLWGLPVALTALAAAQAPMKAVYDRVAMMAASGVLIVAALHIGLAPFLKTAFDLRPVATYVRALQDKGILVANVHTYHGQYHFLGRLETPLAITWQHEAVAWAKAHPGAKLIVTHRELPEGLEPEFVQRFRGRLVAVWNAGDIAADKGVVVP